MLIGETLDLRPVTVGDAKLLTEWFNDPEYLGPFFNVNPHSEAEWEKDLSNEESSSDDHMYLITRRETAEPMGLIGHMNPFTFGSYQGREIWYQVHQQFRRKGIARQAASLLVNHLFDSTPVERIEAKVVVGNDASCRVLEGAGMQHEGICRRVFFLHGRYVDLHLYSIIREEWADETSYRAARRPF